MLSRVALVSQRTSITLANRVTIRTFQDRPNYDKNNNDYRERPRPTPPPTSTGFKPRYLPYAIVLGFVGFAYNYLERDHKLKAKVLGFLPHSYDDVARDIKEILEDTEYEDGSFGPLLVRLAWHSAGSYDKASNTGGTNGATMRFRDESSYGANNGLKLARVLLEQVKSRYPWISYADLYTLAGCVAIKELGGPSVLWRGGRTDAPAGTPCPPDGRLPDASKGERHIRDVFYRMGFNDQEIVALIGAHALGRCHPERSGYSGPWTRSPTTFSNEFFRELLENTWRKKKWNGPEQYEDPTGELMMLPSDLALIHDPKFRVYVEKYAKDEEAFFKDFAKAFQKLMELGVSFPPNAPTYKP